MVLFPVVEAVAQSGVVTSWGRRLLGWQRDTAVAVSERGAASYGLASRVVVRQRLGPAMVVA